MHHHINSTKNYPVTWEMETGLNAHQFIKVDAGMC